MPEDRLRHDELSDPELPVVLRIAGWHCLVVGGGGVAARRAATLLDAGAVVTLVATEPGPDVRAITAPDLVVVVRPYRDGDAAGFRLVVAATGDPVVDRQVVEEAESLGALSSGADRSTAAGLGFPAVWRSGSVTVAVSTEGRSPALARWLRTRLHRALPNELTRLVELSEEARTLLAASGRPTGSLLWDPFLDQMAELLEAGQEHGAETLVIDATRR